MSCNIEKLFLLNIHSVCPQKVNTRSFIQLSVSICSTSFMRCDIFCPRDFLRTGFGLIRLIFVSTSLRSASSASFLLVFNLLRINWFCLFCCISDILFIADTVFLILSFEYLTGTFLRFSKSKVESTANSFPAAFLKAFVHRTFLGFLFLLKALWHFARQNLKTLQSFLTKATP